MRQRRRTPKNETARRWRAQKKLVKKLILCIVLASLAELAAYGSSNAAAFGSASVTPARPAAPKVPTCPRALQTNASVLNPTTWYLTLPVGAPAAFGPPIPIDGLPDRDSAYFYPTYSGSGYNGTLESVTFYAPYGPGSATTANSTFARSELREVSNDAQTINAKGDWSLSTAQRTLYATLRIDNINQGRAGSGLIIGQIHSDPSTDGEVIKLYYRSDGTIHASYDDQKGETPGVLPLPRLTIPLRQAFSYEIDVNKGVVTVGILYNSQCYSASYNAIAYTKAHNKTWTKTGEGFYFKAGDYNQDDTDPINSSQDTFTSILVSTY